MRGSWHTLALLALGLGLAACSQAPQGARPTDVGVTPQFGTAGYDVGRTVFVKQDLGAVYVGGLYNSQPHVRRYTRNGGLYFAKKLANPENGASDFSNSPDNAFITTISDDDRTDIYKYSASGQLLWQTYLCCGKAEAPQTDAKANIYIFQQSDDPADSNLLTKLNSQGKKQSEASLPRFNTQTVAPDGSVYGVSFTDTAVQVSKYSPQFKRVWTKRLVSGNYAVYALRVGNDGLYFGGEKRYTNSNDDGVETDGLVIKADLSGNLKWLKTFGTKSLDNFQDLTLDNQGSAYVTGYTSGVLAGQNAGTTDFFVRKYNTSGGVVWTRQYGGVGEDESFSIAAMSASELYVTGSTTEGLGAGNQGGDADAFLVRLDGNGNQIWVR